MYALLFENSVSVCVVYDEAHSSFKSKLIRINVSM